jgi:sulfur carrier protein
MSSTPATITVRTDDGPLCLPTGSSVADAMARLQAERGVQAHQVATAVNGQFVPRGQRADHMLNDGDTVLCFSPITGG